MDVLNMVLKFRVLDKNLKTYRIGSTEDHSYWAVVAVAPLLWPHEDIESVSVIESQVKPDQEPVCPQVVAPSAMAHPVEKLVGDPGPEVVVDRIARLDAVTNKHASILLLSVHEIQQFR